MFNKFLITTFILLISIASCSSKKTTKKIEPVKSTKEIVTPKPIKTASTNNSYEAIPLEIFKNIFENCNSLDVTFYEGDKTINLWDKNVKYILSMINTNKPQTLDNNVIGHIMMLKDGDTFVFNGQNLSLVEISMKGNNNYVIFNFEGKDKKTKYYNILNQKGVEFFSKMSGKTK